MTEFPERPGVVQPTPIGPYLDRKAARRALASAYATPDVLSKGSVTVLARDVISRLVTRGSGESNAAGRTMADALLSPDDGASLRLTTRLIAQGVTVEEVYLTHLAGAARFLGLRRQLDDLSSTQMTIAAARIHAIIRGLGTQFAGVDRPDGRHAIFATVPGEKHTLGVTMAADLFRRDGWEIDLKVGRSHAELLAELEVSDFAILGLSVSTPDSLQELIRLVAAVRIAHPHAKIVVAGQLAELEPTLQDLTAADKVSSKLDTLRAVMRRFHNAIAAQSGIARV